MQELSNESNNLDTLTFEQVEEYINSNRFVELLTKCEVTDENNFRRICSKLIGVAIDYADIFSRSNTASLKEMEKILTAVIKKENGQENYEIENAFYNKILKDCNLKSNTELSENEDAFVREKVLEYLEFKITKFHAFNGSFLDSIKENGINPNKKMHTEESNAIYKLLDKYGACSTKIKADDGQVSYSLNGSVSYKYALTSPEWFSLLCGQNNYIKRDHNACRQEFLTTAKNYNFSNEDEKILMDLFEKCWQSFAKNEMYVAITPNDLLYGEKEKEKLRKIFNEKLYFNNARSVFNVSLSTRDEAVNERSNTTIDTENTTFLKLPNFNELTKEVEIQRQKDATQTSQATFN